MKILASTHREAQIEWFAKRGFSCLGVLVIFGSSSEKDSNEILYHFFISDDTTQDTDAVNTAKHFLYKEVLPKYGMKKVHFRCDGAGAFNCAKSKGNMARWYLLTNQAIVETSFKVMVSGGGKTSLDGLFGIMTQHLNRLVNHGHSFATAEELYELLVKFPLRHSEFHLFQPNRDNMVDWSVTREIEELGIKSFYRLEYDEENECTTAFYHSRHSVGVRLNAVDEFGKSKATNLSLDQKEDPDLHNNFKSIGNGDIDKMKKSELIDKCVELGLSRQGNKPELKSRLKEYITLHSSRDDDSSAKSIGTETYELTMAISGKNQELSQFEIGHNDECTSSSEEGEYCCSDETSAYSKAIIKSVDVNNPWIHIVNSTWSMSQSSCTRERSVHSKLDYQSRKLLHDERFMDQKNKKFENMKANDIEALQNAGLYICPCVNDDTKERCLRKFMHAGALTKHMKCCEEGKEKHLYAKTDLYSNILLDVTKGKWALALSIGSLSNRCRAISKGVEIIDAQSSTIYNHFKKEWYADGCYRSDVRPRKVFRGTKELTKDLELLFRAGERRDGGGAKKNAAKYTPEQAIARLANMKDNNGRRKYSHRENNPNGPLPSEAYVRSWFSRQKTRKQKRGGDLYDTMTHDELKSSCLNTFFAGDNNVTRKDFVVKMLMMEDTKNDESDLYKYENFTVKQLDEMRKIKNLPGPFTMLSYRHILRLHDQISKMNEHAKKVNDQIHFSITVADAMEETTE